MPSEPFLEIQPAVQHTIKDTVRRHAVQRVGRGWRAELMRVCGRAPGIPGTLTGAVSYVLRSWELGAGSWELGAGSCEMGAESYVSTTKP